MFKDKITVRANNMTSRLTKGANKTLKALNVKRVVNLLAVIQHLVANSVVLLIKQLAAKINIGGDGSLPNYSIMSGAKIV